MRTICNVPSLLVIARLTVRSSYRGGREEPSNSAFDTVQFYVPAAEEAGAQPFRVRTFALDHDIHVHRLGGGLDDPEGLLRTGYGAVVGSLHRVPLRERSSRDLAAAGLTGGHLEVAPDFAFWNPDGAAYVTQSTPLPVPVTPPPEPVAPDAPIEGRVVDPLVDRTTGPLDRRDLVEVVYLGGIARFWLPTSWQIHMSVDEGGCFYDPDSDGTLRLNVLHFDTSAATGPPPLRHPTKENERAIDGGRLPNGCEFDVYERDSIEDGEPVRTRFWHVAHLVSGQCRIYLFSYAYPVIAEERVADELARVDASVRQLAF
jgi:hypothetical protein